MKKIVAGVFNYFENTLELKQYEIPDDITSFKDMLIEITKQKFFIDKDSVIKETIEWIEKMPDDKEIIKNNFLDGDMAIEIITIKEEI